MYTTYVMNVGIFFCQVLVRTYCKPLPTSSVALDTISKFSQKVIEWFLKKKHHFTSPPLWKFSSPNVTEKAPKIHLILIQSKIPFGAQS